MFWNKNSRKHVVPTFKLLSLSILTLSITACGGGGDSAEAAAIGIEDVSIAYIKRPTPRDENGIVVSNDMTDPTQFTAGGDLYVQARASSTASIINISRSITNGVGDVKDIAVSYDGSKLLFSLRLEDLTNGNNVPTWNLYEYDISSGSLTALISSGLQEKGDDISPQYLPDDRIVFASTRQKVSKGIRINEGRDGVLPSTDENRNNASFSLHVLETDGTIKQISFNQSNDLDPIILKESGRILFSRWNNMGSRNDISLYSMNPDGTDVQLYYGAHSHRTGQDPSSDVHFYKPREMQDGRILTILRPLVTNFGGGDIIFIDGKNYADNTQPIWSQQSFLSGIAQSIFKQNISTATGLSLKGRYNATFPMLDGSNRYLMSWSQCQILDVPTDPNSRIIPCTLATPAQLNDPALVEAPPSYGIFLVDASTDTQVPLIRPEADTLFSEVIMAYSTKIPPIIFDKVDGSTGFDQANATNAVGTLHIRSVYDFDNNFASYGVTLPVTDNDGIAITIDTPEEMANPKNTIADDRPARFIRLTKNVSFSNPLPNGNRLSNTAFGRSNQQGMREIIGYAPVEPDGSVKIKVPADVPLTISVLDKDGRRISNRHQYWFQVKPGETLECVGCHVHDTNNQADNKPHGRPDYSSEFNKGAETTGVAFPFSQDALWAEIEETMAETRARQSCLKAAPDTCADMKPSTDLIYSDVWTKDTAANRSADTSFTIDYTDVPVSPISMTDPTLAATACNSADYDDTISSFTYCRIMINYEQHIQPIWEATANRPALQACTSCHTTNGNTQVAEGQLELTDGDSSDQNDHLVSYRELLFNDNEQVLDSGALTDLLVPTGAFLLDANGDQVLVGGNPVPITTTVNVSPTMSTGGANSSSFITIMTTDRTIGTDPNEHHLMLTASELKLISEWLDIGAQYFNDPFDADTPTN